MEFLRLGLLGLFLLVALLSLQLEASLTNHGGVLGLEVPNLPSSFSTNGNPVASGVEGETVD